MAHFFCVYFRWIKLTVGKTMKYLHNRLLFFPNNQWRNSIMEYNEHLWFCTDLCPEHSLNRPLSQSCQFKLKFITSNPKAVGLPHPKSAKSVIPHLPLFPDFSSQALLKTPQVLCHLPEFINKYRYFFQNDSQKARRPECRFDDVFPLNF